MTQRSMLAGTAPTIIIKAGASVRVQGGPGDRVTAETDDTWGLKIEKRSAAEFARARAALGERVLFDLRLKRPSWDEDAAPEDVIEVQLGGSGQVQVPAGSSLKVYAGQDIVVQAVAGQVDAYSGRTLRLQSVGRLGNASAGWTMDLDCQTLRDGDVEYKSGSDLRFRVKTLTSARLRVKDLGGYWEARIGAGEKRVSLKCGGDVTLVTDQAVEALPPNYLLGQIEPPPDA